MHINCLLKHVFEAKIDGRRVTQRRGRRLKHVPDDLKETRGYRKLKEEALDGAEWRTRFGIRYGPASRQTTQWMCRLLFKEYLTKNTNPYISRSLKFWNNIIWNGWFCLLSVWHLMLAPLIPVKLVTLHDSSQINVITQWRYYTVSELGFL